MGSQNQKRGVLVVDAGPEGLVEFEGYLFGAEAGTAKTLKAFQDKAQDFGYGEVVFNTSLTGYQEILTDPSYFGQIVCMTVPHVGNYGINSDDVESRRIWCGAFVVDDLEEIPSNFASEKSLSTYLKEAGVPGLYGVDTRAITQFLRKKGASRGVILPIEEKSKAAEIFKTLPEFGTRDLLKEVSTREPYFWNKPKTTKFKVVALDYGIKWNLLRELEDRGCEVEVLPATSTSKDILSRKPDGVFLSNGPGDPEKAPYAVTAVKEVLGKVPVFGVCMGHQILSLALGAKTYKLKFGHRGGNQPVLDQDSDKVEISSHNHGYAVDSASLPEHAHVSHLNLNDQTCEGIRVPKLKAFSVQYHPEASPGPRDSEGLFDEFIDLMNDHSAK
jgi:carbamoyl-phosphate synthase small subunit